MNVRSLRPNANVENLRKQARQLLRQFKTNDAKAVSRIQQYFKDETTVGLKRVQLVLAREYGFDSWNKLTAAVKSQQKSRSKSLSLDGVEDELLSCFRNGNVSGAKELLKEHRGILGETYLAHHVLRMFVDGNSGHCYKKSHLEIADLLIPSTIKHFRDAVLADDIPTVKKRIREEPQLVSAEFTAGRGIAQPIHHFESVEMAEVLVESGADVNARTTVHHLGDTPVGLQARFGKVEGVKYLLEQGANPNGGLLKFMGTDAMPVLIPLMVKHGWDINEGSCARTLIHHDAAHGHGRKVCLLLAHGADANARDANGRTALHLLAERGSGDAAIRALFEAGASLDAKDKDGMTPLDLARKAERKNALDTLLALHGS